jgi:hypothetical protein
VILFQQIQSYWFQILLIILTLGAVYSLWRLLKTLSKIPLNEGASETNPQSLKNNFLPSMRLYSILLVCFFVSATALVIVMLSLNTKTPPINNGANGKEEPITMTISIGESGTAFNNELMISVIQTRYEGNPPRYRVFATILSPGYSEMVIERQDTGFTATYTGKAKYNIQVLEATANFARFLVIRKQD